MAAYHRLPSTNMGMLESLTWLDGKISTLAAAVCAIPVTTETQSVQAIRGDRLPQEHMHV